MKMPESLKEIKNCLIETNLQLSNSFEDGRVNARINEDEVLKIIKNRFEIEIPRSRHWFDFSIKEKGAFCPVNIKITDTTHADNLNCKLGVYFALTGKIPDFPNECSWLDYFERLKKNIGRNSNDYFFLVINKDNIADIFINSLKCLQTLQPNGNNLPFQCKWNINIEPKNRDFEEAKKYILRIFGESIKQRVEIYFIFKRLFNEYL